MRKIEQEMNRAIRERKSWRKGNTEVVFLGTDRKDGYVLLHGNRIATIQADGTIIPDRETVARWPTVTTRSRLNALGIRTYQRNHTTYVFGTAVN